MKPKDIADEILKRAVEGDVTNELKNPTDAAMRRAMDDVGNRLLRECRREKLEALAGEEGQLKRATKLEKELRKWITDANGWKKRHNQLDNRIQGDELVVALVWLVTVAVTGLALFWLGLCVG